MRVQEVLPDVYRDEDGNLYRDLPQIKGEPLLVVPCDESLRPLNDGYFYEFLASRARGDFYDLAEYQSRTQWRHWILSPAKIT